jgi:type IV pilus assembly protein PilO
MKDAFRPSKYTLLKYAIVGVLGTLLAADATMTVYSIRIASSMMSPQQEVNALTIQLKLLQADVKRAREIQQQMPTTKADCERFENSLPPAGSGYSVISADIEQIGHSAGLLIDTLSFHPADLAGRGITEVALDATVSGNYKSIVHFLNGIQHSQNHYIVDVVSLANERAGQAALPTVRVNLHLRSYFKAGA